MGEGRLRVLLFGVITAVFAPRLVSSQDFQFFVFSQQWAGSICAISNCTFTPPPEIWTIHGLWPSNSTSPQPESCKTCDFDIGSLAPIVKTMNSHWPSYFYSNKLFWQHEWCKHGTCAEQEKQLNSELKYFNATLQLNIQMDLFGALKKLNFTEDGCYEYADFTAAVNRRFTQTALFSCAWDNDKKQSMIGQIELCMSTDLQRMDCSPPPVHSLYTTRPAQFKGAVHLSPCRPSEKICYPPQYKHPHPPQV